MHIYEYRGWWEKGEENDAVDIQKYKYVDQLDCCIINNLYKLCIIYYSCCYVMISYTPMYVYPRSVNEQLRVIFLPGNEDRS